MHKIADKEFTFDDFSHEHLMSTPDWFHDEKQPEEKAFTTASPVNILDTIITSLNSCRCRYLATKDKKYWWQMIQLLPSSYNQKRTVMLNYEVLSNIYHSREDHKLIEWHQFCDWIKDFPYSELITGE